MNSEGIDIYGSNQLLEMRQSRLTINSFAEAFRRAEKKIIKQAKEKILKIYDDILNHGFSNEPPFVIGHVESRMIRYAKRNGISLEHYDIWMSSGSLAHARRDEKILDGVDTSIEDIANFPLNKKKMDLYFDKDGKTFIYTDYKNKYVVSPSKRLRINRKTTYYPNFVTAYKVNDANEFNMVDKYEKIK